MLAKLTRGVRETLEDFGEVPPIIVRDIADSKDGCKWEIIDGEHRWRVFQNLRIPEIPYISLGKVSDTKAKILTSQLNWLRGEPDSRKYASMIESILEDRDDRFTLEDLALRLPESEEILEDLLTVFGSASDVDTQEEKKESDEEDDGSYNVEEDFDVELSLFVKASVGSRFEGIRIQLSELVADYIKKHPDSQSALINPEKLDDLLIIVCTRMFDNQVKSFDDVLRLLRKK